MNFSIDLKLLALRIELTILESHFQFIEEEIVRAVENADREFQDKLQTLGSQDEAEWDLLRQERDFQVEFFLPRVFRGAFLVTLFSVYETAVTEIAELIQDKRGIKISLDDLRHDLLTRAKIYYSNVLDFELSKSDKHWQRIKLLSDLRNAIAHRDGRLNMMTPTVMNRLLKAKGISERFGYIVVDESFLQDTFSAVKEELEELVARYSQWETEHRTLHQT